MTMPRTYFPHVVRKSTDYVEYTTPGAAPAIVTLPSDHSTWTDADGALIADHEFHEIPVHIEEPTIDTSSISDDSSDLILIRVGNITIARKPYSEYLTRGRYFGRT